MTRLHIEHPITDYGQWKAAFDGFAAMRLRAGVRGHILSRPVDDAAYIIIDLDLDTRYQAEHFLRILRERVWADRAKSPALAGEPVTSILDVIERVEGEVTVSH